MKILSYNILNGFCGDRHPFIIDKERMESAIKIIEREKPDVIVLLEAYFWPFAKQVDLKDMKKVFSEIYDEYANLNYFDFRWAPIILSKYPITSFDISKLKYKINHIRAEIKKGKKIITVDGFHPYPSVSEEKKSRFLKDTIKNENYIIAGDFNSISPEDKYNKGKLFRGFRSFMIRKGKQKVRELLKCTAIKTLLEKNLIDSYKTKNPKKTESTMPSDLRSKNKDSSIRIDYIFNSKDIEVIDAKIIKDPLTEKASDHYPVFAELKV